MNICILGSLNMDLVISTSQLPIIGETVHGIDNDYLLGGKGANQAVAASRMNTSTSLIGCIGGDFFGEKILQQLSKEEYLDCSSIEIKKDLATGIATVFKLKEDNAIVVVPGANSFCDTKIVDKYKNTIKNCSILLSQLEIPIETIYHAFKYAKCQGLTTILNPAPYTHLPNNLLNYVDYITPNDSEFEGLCNQVFKSDSQLEDAMINWCKNHNTTLIVTRGKKGCSFVKDNKVISIPSISVPVVDTTGAGDTFNGILAFALSEKLSLYDSIKYACIGASLSVRSFGAQTGMPTKKELNEYFKGDF